MSLAPAQGSLAAEQRTLAPKQSVLTPEQNLLTSEQTPHAFAQSSPHPHNCKLQASKCPRIRAKPARIEAKSESRITYANLQRETPPFPPAPFPPTPENIPKIQLVMMNFRH